MKMYCIVCNKKVKGVHFDFTSTYLTQLPLYVAMQGCICYDNIDAYDGAAVALYCIFIEKMYCVLLAMMRGQIHDNTQTLTVTTVSCETLCYTDTISTRDQSLLQGHALVR